MIFPGGASGKDPTCQCRRCKRCGFKPCIRKIPLEQGMATHSSILAWRIPWTEEPGRLQSVGSQRADTTEQLTLCSGGSRLWCNPVTHPVKQPQNLKMMCSNGRHFTRSHLPLSLQPQKPFLQVLENECLRHGSLPTVSPWAGPHPEQAHSESELEDLTSAPASSPGRHPLLPAPRPHAEPGPLLFLFCSAVNVLTPKFLQGCLPFPDLRQ